MVNRKDDFMKKKLLLVALAMVSMFTLAACSTGSEDATEASSEQAATEEPTNEQVSEETESADKTEPTAEGTITMLVPGYDEGYLTEPLDAAIAKYEKEKGVKVEVISAGWDELNSKIVQLYQAQQAPDIMLVGSRSIRQFAELGVLEDMTPYLDEEFLATRIENVMDTAKFDGKQYGVPMAYSSRALFYRTDLIETPPTNWEELLQTAKTVAADNDMYGFAVPTDLTSGTDEILNFVYQAKGRITDDQGNFTINSPENIKAIDYLTQFADIIPDPVGTARGDQVDMFTNGDLAMFVSGTWEKEKLDAAAETAPYGVVVLPEGDTKGATLVTDSYVVSSLSENKDQVADFIKFMSDIDQQKEITAAYNWFPVTKAEESLEVYQEDFMQPFLEIMPHGVPEPQVPNWDEFNKSFTIAVQKALTGQASAEEALTTAQEENTK